MKKILLILSFFWVAGIAAAQEYRIDPVTGERRFDTLYDQGSYSGGEFTLGLGGAYAPAHNSYGQDYASTGFVGNAGLFLYMTPYVAAGVDYSYDGQRSKDGPAGEYTLSAHLLSGAFKIRINPYDKLRFYLPIGVGAGGVYLKHAAPGVQSTTAEKWGLSVFAGLGMEVDIAPSVFLALEYRYVCTFVQPTDVDPLSGSNRYFQFHQAMLKVGLRLF